MFESLVGEPVGDACPEGEPGPGDPGYAALLVYEAQQEAYWSAVALGELAIEDGRAGSAGRSDAGLLAAAGRAERAAAAAEGAKLRAVADFVLRRIAAPDVGPDAEARERSAQAEVGFALRLPASEAADLTHLALYLARRLPKTFAALEEGLISLRKVRILVEESANLSVAQCARLEEAVLGEAPARSPRSWRDRIRRVVEDLDADAVRRRRAAARARRCLWVRDEPDGMATLCLYLPGEQARAIYATINARIPAQPGPGDDRLIGARRADEIVEVLSAALGVDLRAVADTEGAAGPVLTAEQIARLDRGADSYVPSPAMKAAIRARDRHCRFPGCRRPAVHCDVDSEDLMATSSTA